MKPNNRVRPWVLGSLLWLAGCATQPAPGDKAFAPATPARVAPQATHSGSIFQTGAGLSLFEDVVARRVGDVLTIRLVEKTDAKKKADTSVLKDSDSSVGAAIKGTHVTDRKFDFGLKGERDADGKAESKQSNSLTGNISVVVSNVLPNGNLVVRGEKWMTLNQGDEYIRIAGIVRPQDIAPDNTVPSYQVADARISYSGTGPLADSNALGWITRFFISAMFPF